MQPNSPASAPQLQTLSRQSFWQRHVLQWQSSGISKMAYCQQHSLVYHQMVYWSGKVENTAVDAKPHTSGDFVRVAVSSASHNSTLSIRLPNGIAIEGIDECSVALVGKLIEQL